MISKLPPPISIKVVRSFLYYDKFYRNFIKDFLKIGQPLCKILEKKVNFGFCGDFLRAFNCLKELLVSTPIITALDWSIPLEVKSDSSGVALGAVLGQRKENLF